MAHKVPVAGETLAGIAEVQQEGSAGRRGGKPDNLNTVT